MEDISKATWWQKEIEKKARKRLDYIIYLLMVITLFSIVLFAYILTFTSEGGMLGPLEITKQNAKYALFVSNIINGGIGIAALAAIWKLREPKFMRYQQSALKIVDMLRKEQLIDNKKEMKMLDTISKNLTPCIDPTKRNECEEGLSRVSVSLAKIAEQ